VNRHMRIAFVSLGYAPLRTSGLDISGERLVKALLQDGNEITVVAGKRGQIVETEYHPHLHIERAAIGPSNWIGFAYRAASQIRQLTKTRRFDVVHFWDVHFAYAYSGAYVASLQHSFRQRLACIRQSPGAGRSRLARIVYYRLAQAIAERRALKNATGLIAGSKTTRDEFITHYRVAPDRIALACHGIDTDFFSPSPHGRRAVRRRYGIAPEDPVIMFAGFVTARKGLDFLAQALPFIRPEPQLLIVGRWSESYRRRFRTILGPRVTRVIEAGFVPDQEMPSFYSASDVYVSPSLLEGFGLPLAESLACQTPVVAADAGAVGEVVGPGGILVPPGDARALADAVSRLLADPSERQLLGEHGRQHVAQHFDIRISLRATLDAYEHFTSQATWPR